MTPRKRGAVLVDGDRPAPASIEETCWACGYRLEVFRDAGALLAAHGIARFPLLLLWCGGTSESAAETCRTLLRAPGGAVVVAIDAHAGPDAAAHLLEAGAADVLAGDPLDTSALRTWLVSAGRFAVQQSHADAMLDALPDLVFRVARTGHFLDFHAPSTHDLYVPPGRIVGSRMADVMPEGLTRGCMAAVEKALETRALQVFEYSLSVPAGAMDFEARFVPSGADEVLVVIRNVTTERRAEAVTQRLAAAVETSEALEVEIAERRRAEEALRASEAQWRSLVENCPDLVMTIDRDGRVLFDNRGLVGPTRGGRASASLFDLTARADHGRIRAALARVFDDGEAAALDVSARGGKATYEGRIAPIRRGAAIPLGILISRDVTERLAAEAERVRMHEKLLQVQKLDSLGLLAGGIAHDFNNLLTAILGSASVALLKLGSASAARPPIEALVSAARRAADLTQQLLAYSGKGRFQIRAIDLSEHIREIVALLEAAVPKQVCVRLELEAGLPAVECDVAQLQQVVMNLVINAAEAIGDERGTVRILTGHQRFEAAVAEDVLPGDKLLPGLYVFLEVHDTGRGMDEETRAKVFDPFFTTKATGRGLGLAAVLGIVRSHKGSIKIYSSLGRGTTFKVFLPTDGSPADAAREVASEEPLQGTGTVMIVDDEAMLRRAAREVVEHFGYVGIEAAGGEQAAALYRERADEIVAVVLDMTMPGMSGEETFRELLRISPDVTVILSSGYSEIEATRRFTSRGLAGFLQKPYSAEQLGECLANAVSGRAKK